MSTSSGIVFKVFKTEYAERVNRAVYSESDPKFKGLAGTMPFPLEQGDTVLSTSNPKYTDDKRWIEIKYTRTFKAGDREMKRQFVRVVSRYNLIDMKFLKRDQTILAAKIVKRCKQRFSITRDLTVEQVAKLVSKIRSKNPDMRPELSLLFDDMISRHRFISSLLLGHGAKHSHISSR